ncbi:MAG: phage baseplate protein [Bacteroidota bacterium]
MAPLTASALLDLCEKGRVLPPVDRALLLLEVAQPDETSEALASLPLGWRDERLLAFRESSLGPVLEVESRCPACAEHLELDLQSADLRAVLPPGGPPSAPREVDLDGARVAFRLPTSQDVRESDDAEDILRRCVVSMDSEGDEPKPLTPEERATLTSAMAGADPLAEIVLDLSCPACTHTWTEVLDVASFLWAELEDWVPRVVRDVHRLASAYGWAERDVLGMSAWRRDQYLSLIDS